MERQNWMILAAVLWTTTLSLAAYSTATSGLVAALWSVLFATAACVPTGWVILDSAMRRERHRVESIVAIAVAEARRERRQVDRIH